MRSLLHSNNLVPFKKRREAYHLPECGQDGEAYALEQLDPGLSAEEQSYVRHYLAYADTLLGNMKRSRLPGQDGEVRRPLKKDMSENAA